MIPILKNLQSVMLIMIALGFLGLLGADGHHLILSNFGEMRWVLEMLVFLVTGILLRRHVIHPSTAFNRVVIVLMCLVIPGLIDAIIDLLQGDVTWMVLLLILMLLNQMYIVYIMISQEKKIDNV